MASPTNGDMYSSVSGHAFFCQGKLRDGLEGWEQGWKVEDGCLVNTADVASIGTKMQFGKEGLVVSAYRFLTGAMWMLLRQRM